MGGKSLDHKPAHRRLCQRRDHLAQLYRSDGSWPASGWVTSRISCGTAAEGGTSVIRGSDSDLVTHDYQVQVGNGKADSPALPCESCIEVQMSDAHVDESDELDLSKSQSLVSACAPDERHGTLNCDQTSGPPKSWHGH